MIAVTLANSEYPDEMCHPAYTGFKLGPDSREKWPLSRKIREKWQSDREKLIAQNYHIFCQFRSKLAITHTFAIKWKEKYNSEIVTTEWKWVQKKKQFFS